jgi:hypothetical protein
MDDPGPCTRRACASIDDGGAGATGAHVRARSRSSRSNDVLVLVNVPVRRDSIARGRGTWPCPSVAIDP